MTDENKIHYFPNPNQNSSQSVYSNVGSGGGGGDDMMTRLAKVESDVSSIKEALVRLEPAISAINIRTVGIESDLKHTPKTTSLVFGMLTIFAMGYAIPQIPHIFNQDKIVEKKAQDESKRSTEVKEP